MSNVVALYTRRCSARHFSMVKRLFFVAAFFLAAIQAQSISLGVKLGANLTDPIENSGGTTDQSTRFTVGPTLEIGLPFSLAFEADALYRRTGYDFSTTLPVGSPPVATTLGTKQRANSFEFPLLAKYYFGPKLIPAKLYVSGGYALRYSFNISAPYLVRDNPTNGAVIGGGARFRLGRFGISPELRYTHWSGRTLNQQGGYGLIIRSTQNQADFLVGFTF